MVTGGSGFIGEAVLRLLKGSEVDLLVLSRKDRSAGTKPNLNYFQANIIDRSEIRHVVCDFRPQFLLHLAGTTPWNDRTGNDSFDVNFGATKFLLEECVSIGCERAVLLGSASEYGDNLCPFSEKMAPRPKSAYARSKAEATRFALGLSEQSDLKVCVLRPFTVYGPGQPSSMFISQLIEHAINNEPFEMSDGMQKRDLVFIDDVARAILLAHTRPSAAGHVINIGSGQGTRLRELAIKVWAECVADSNKLLIGQRSKSGDDGFDMIAEIGLADSLLGWKPAVRLEDGLRLMIDRIRENRI